MKIKPEHYAKLEKGVRAAVEQHPHSREAYQKAGMSEKRYRWDLLYASQIDGVSGNLWICDALYPYANDDHIDTALRRITRTT